MQYILIFILAVCIGIVSLRYAEFKLKLKHKVLSLRTTGFIVISIVLVFGLYLTRGMDILFYIYSVTSGILLSLSYVDYKSFEIPPEYNIAIGILGLFRLILDYEHWYVYIIGACLVSGIFLLIQIASKGKGMGGGDIKLMAAAGLLLGWQKIFFVMAIGSILGALIHGIIMKVSKKDSMLSFGPYLAVAAYIMMTFGDGILSWYIRYFFSIE